MTRSLRVLAPVLTVLTLVAGVAGPALAKSPARTTISAHLTASTVLVKSAATVSGAVSPTGGSVGIGRDVRGRGRCVDALGELRRAMRLLKQRSIQCRQESRPDRTEGVGGDGRGGQLGRYRGEVIGVTTVGDAEPMDVRRIGDHAVMTPAGALWFH